MSELELDLSLFQGTVTMADVIVPEDRIKLALIGLPKSGKSHTAATSETPIWIWDLDERAESLKDEHAQKNLDLKNIYIRTLFDHDADNPHAFEQLEADVTMFEYLKEQGKPIPKSFILDSGTFLGKSALNYYYKNNGASKFRIKLGNTVVDVPRGFDPYMAEVGLIESICKRVFRLGHTILVLHEGDEKDKKSSKPNEAVYTGFKTVYPPRYQNLLPMFNECWRQTIVGGEYKVQVKSNYEFLGATTFYLDGEEEPNIARMLTKHRERAMLAKLEQQV